jgi:tRNA threonylcarbamoyladenosine biosynthesis protein TsaE
VQAFAKSQPTALHTIHRPVTKISMSSAVSPDTSRQLDLADQAATEALANCLSGQLHKGDVVALSGDLGAGKTAFARAFIRACGQKQGTLIDEVPSPTFTIVQIYDEVDPAVWHVDLYRLEDRADTIELGLEEAFEEGISLIEWPDRLGDAMPTDHLSLNFRMTDIEGARQLVISGHGTWRDRLASLETETRA